MQLNEYFIISLNFFFVIYLFQFQFQFFYFVIMTQIVKYFLISLYFTAEVRMPSGKIDLPIVEDNRDGTIRVQYDPREAGVHELILTHDGVAVPGMRIQKI